MKLTKKDKQHLEHILYDMQKTEKYLLKDTTIIATVSSLGHSKESTWINASTGEQAASFLKAVGNDLCYLSNAIRRLQNLITN